MDIRKRASLQYLILLFLFWNLSIPVFSQFSFFKHYTVNNGLPSSKVYDMIEDSRGYMWFATENGVSRYDGYEFKNFTVQDGLPTNSTLKLYEDYKGRMYGRSRIYRNKFGTYQFICV